MMVEQSVLDDRISFYSDYYKDVNGFRPSGESLQRIASLSEPEYDAVIASLGRTLAENLQQEKIEQNEAIAQFEAEIVKLIGFGAVDRATAIKWIVEAEEVDGDMEFLCYKLGLPYDYQF